MKILFVSAYFPPEMGAPANRVWELTRRWAAQGHSVAVLTGFPNHPTGVVPAAYRKKMARGWMREETDGVTVHRVWLYPAPNRRAWERILNYSSFGFSAGLAGPWLPRSDVVVATSPHLLTGWAGWWLSRLHRVPFLLEIRDLWPESLVASGMGKAGSLLIRCLRGMAGFLYRRADRIVTVTEAMAQRLQEDWKVPSDRLTVIEHGVDGTRFAPGNPETNGKPVVSYIGTLGKAHGLETFLDAAERAATRNSDLTFQLIGEGAEKDRLMALSERRALRNVRFIPGQPRQEIPDWIRRSSICVALLSPDELFQTVMPTKVLEYWACGKPVVLAAKGHARRILEESGGGVAVDPGDSQALAEAILRLARDPQLQARLGEQGRRYVLQRFNLETRARAYLDLMRHVVEERCRSRTC